MREYIVKQVIGNALKSNKEKKAVGWPLMPTYSLQSCWTLCW